MAKKVKTRTVAVGKTAAPKAKAAPSKKAKSEKAKMLQVNGHTLKLTNQEKVYWPNEGFTKGDVLEYYNSISNYILPYLKDRPQSLKRNPNGITDKGFFHKDAGENAPDWVDHVKLYSESARKDIDYIICNNKATLLYLNNLGCIEINPWNSRLKNLDHPDYLIMDIDPSDKSTFNEVIDAALVIKEILDKAQAPSYCKTSGATGLHIYVPLNAAYHYDQVRSFAEIIATLTQEELPESTTVERPSKKERVASTSITCKISEDKRWRPFTASGPCHRRQFPPHLPGKRLNGVYILPNLTYGQFRSASTRRVTCSEVFCGRS